MPQLFVYGTLMPGHAPACVADLVGRFAPVGRAAVAGRLYDLDHYPGLVLAGGTGTGGGDTGGAADGTGRADERPAAAATVAGVLVEVPDDPALLRRLDAYEGFDPADPPRSLFRRVSAVARLAGDGRAVDCQTYVYNRTPPPDRLVPGGDWLRRGHRSGTAAAEDCDYAAAEASVPERTHCAVDSPAPERSQSRPRSRPAGRHEPPAAGGGGGGGGGARHLAAPNEPIAPNPTSAHRPMSKRPIIGITTDYVDEKPTRYMQPSDYAASVERAGGLPILLPFRADLSLVPDYVDLVDGVLFTGGSDLDPALYGDEPWHPMATPVDVARQRFELALLAEVERRRTPALGVCLGSQLMNVHRGGTLTQFIPDHLPQSPIEHRYQGNDAFRHEVAVQPGTVLAEVVGRAGPITVNSRHKQAVRALGRGLRANAVAPDGVVEGFEDSSLPLFLAVQWHPENLTAAQPEHAALFKRLVMVSAGARKHEV